MSGILAGSVWVNVLPKMDEFQRTIGRGLAGLQTRAAATGKTLTRHVTLPLALAAAASVKLAVDFDKTFDQMVGLAGVSEGAIEGLKAKVLELAEVTGKAPKELAEGLYFIESSGLKGQKALDALTVSAKLSAAGLGDTKVVADTITSAMNAYATANLTAAKAGDILAATVRDGKGEAQDIAPVLGGLLPLSKRLGIGFDQVGAAIASMTLIGTSAPEAGTALTGFYTSLLNNSPKVVAALKDVGLTAGGLRQEMADPRRGLPSVLQHLEKAFGGNIAKIHEAFPNIRGLRALLALTGDNAKKTQGVFKDLAKSTGAVNTAFGAVTKDKAFKFEQLKSQLKAMGIIIGGELLPVVEDLAAKVSGLINWYKTLTPFQQGLIKKFIIFIAVLGPALSLIAKLITVGKILVTVVGALGDALVFLAANPILLLIAALVIGFVLLYRHSETFRRIVTAAFQAVSHAVGAAVDFIQAHWKALLILLTGPMGAVIVFIVSHFKTIRAVATAVFNGVRTVATKAFHGLMSAAAAVFGWIRSHWRLMAVILGGPIGLAAVFIANHFGTIKAKAVAAFNKIRSTVGPVLDSIKSKAGKVFHAIGGFAGDLGGHFHDLYGAIKPVLDKLSWLMDKAGSIGHAIGHVANAAESVLGGMAGGGHLSGGQPQLVGEIGPEVFIPDVPGRIVPNNHMAAVLNGMGGGGRAALTITNWRDGTGYFEVVADSSVRRASALSSQRGRMRR